MRYPLECPQCHHRIEVLGKTSKAWCRCGAQNRLGRPLMLPVVATEEKKK